MVAFDARGCDNSKHTWRVRKGMLDLILSGPWGSSSNSFSSHASIPSLSKNVPWDMSACINGRTYNSPQGMKSGPTARNGDGDGNRNRETLHDVPINLIFKHSYLISHLLHHHLVLIVPATISMAVFSIPLPALFKIMFYTYPPPSSRLTSLIQCSISLQSHWPLLLPVCRAIGRYRILFSVRLSFPKRSFLLPCVPFRLLAFQPREEWAIDLYLCLPPLRPQTPLSVFSPPYAFLIRPRGTSIATGSSSPSLSGSLFQRSGLLTCLSVCPVLSRLALPWRTAANDSYNQSRELHSCFFC